MTENFENWDEIIPLEKELKAVRKNLRARNWKIILTSVVLVIALLLAVIKVGIPVAEKQYWNPTQCSYLEDITDLELTMSTYSELFGHGQHLVAVETQKDGFASYSVDAVFANWKSLRNLTDVSYGAAVITKGTLSYPMNFWNNTVGGRFIQNDNADAEYIKRSNNETLRYLRQLPEYIVVFASVTFSEELPMSELLRLSSQYVEDAEFTWAALCDGDYRNAECGVHLASNYDHQYSPENWDEIGYPDLFVERIGWRANEMETHIKSMLKFSDDQLRNGQGILAPNEDPAYYANTLNYMEENGVKAYGSYVIATPQTLLKMMEDGRVSYISVMKAQVGLP